MVTRERDRNMTSVMSPNKPDVYVH